MFWSVAFAQASEAARPGLMEQLLPFIGLIAIFYFLIIRPQVKRQRNHQKLLEGLKRGDSVLTSGGILGTIEGITEKYVTLEVSDGVRLRILRSYVASAAGKEENK